jgi:hypothetical protein
MDEAHFKEIEATMLYVEEARWRAERAVAALTRDGAEQHLIEAAGTAKQELSEIHRRLMQGTLFAVPSAQGSL